MYLRDTDPLPPNSETPSSDCYNWGVCLQNTMAQSIANAQAASASIAGPSSFTSFGPGVVTDVARSQNAMAAANLAAVPSPSTQQFLSAPKVVPLNVTQEEYSGCAFRSGVILPTSSPSRRIVAPIPAPTPVVLPAVATPPKWSNLCWALRNAMVDASQFDPTELNALQWRCTQQGYAGACYSSPEVALYLDQGRRAGTLPHISVSQSEIDSIPPAPPLTGVSCPDALKLAGMAGYRRRGGMGAVWGDAGSLPTGGGWPARSQSSANWKALLFFGAVGVGLYVMAGQHGRG